MAYKIAIVEDDASISQMYKLKFEAEGYQVVTAENGKQGLEVIKKSKPDLVLLDLMMPEMTGGEMLKLMRGTDWGKYIKVIILTNVSKDEVDDDIKDMFIEDYIVKAHYTPQQVAQTVEAVLKSS